MSYQFEGENSNIEQVLSLDFKLLVLSVVFLEGAFLHPLLDSRIGMSIGRGNNDLTLITQSNEALEEQVVDVTYDASGSADFLELFFESELHSGWGYRLGVFIVDTVFDESNEPSDPDGSSSPSIYLTILWQY